MDKQNIPSGSIRISIGPVLAFVGFLLIFQLIGKQLFDNLREGIRRDVQNNIAAVGTLKTNQIEYWLQDRMADAGIFSVNSFFSGEAGLWLRDGARKDARRRHLIERMGYYLKGHGFRSVVMYDPAGHILLNVGEPVAHEKAITEAVRRVAASGQSELIDLHRHQDTAFPVRFGFLGPVQEDAEVLGAIYLVEDPAHYLYPLVHQWPGNSDSAETALVRREGDDVLFLDKLRHRDELPLTFRLPLAAPQLAAAMALRGKRGLLEQALDYRGKPVLAYATAIKGSPWMMLSKIDEEEAYRTIDQMQRAAGIFELFVFGLIGAWFWQWRRREQAAADAAILQEHMRVEAVRQETEKRFRTIFEQTALPMVRNSLTGEFIEVNEAWCVAFGYSRDEVLSQHLSWQKVTHPEDVGPGAILVKKLLAGEIDDFRIEKRYLRKDGSVLWGTAQVSLVRDARGEPDYFISAIQDITERKNLEKMLEDNLAILKMALEGAQEAVWEWDLVSGEAVFSPQYYTMLGYMPDEFPANQQEWLSRIHPEDRDQVWNKIQNELAQHQEIYIAEYRMRARDGRYRWIQGRGKCSASDANGRPTRMVGINIDITERKQSEQQISFMAYHDKLTGLPNRALLFDRLSQAMSQARRDAKHVALLFVDLDGFKAVNDQYGHEAGDAVLKMSAQRFLACVRAVDTVSRFGGDEFAIILGNLDEPQLAKSVAEKIVQAFAHNMVLADGAECKVGASVGISIYPEHGSAMDNLLTAADHAMYESKRLGRNTYSFYKEAMPVKEQNQWLKLEAGHLGGVREIDEQHLNLAYLVNRLNDSLKRNDSTESIAQMFEELLVATTHHFETESRYMANSHYPDQVAHELEHAKLIGDAAQLKSQFGDGRELLAMQSLKDWLLDHIANSDKKLAAYLVQHGVK